VLDCWRDAVNALLEPADGAGDDTGKSLEALAGQGD